MPTHGTTRQQIGRYGALKSWSRTVDRTARTRSARKKSPGGIEYHLARLGPEFADATDRQRLDAAEAARKTYFAELAMRSAKARSRQAGRGEIR